MCGQALVPLVAEVYTWGGQKTIRRCSPSNVWVSGMELESLALEPSPQPSFDHLRCIGLCVFVHYVKKFGNEIWVESKAVPTAPWGGQPEGHLV